MNSINALKEHILLVGKKNCWARWH